MTTTGRGIDLADLGLDATDVDAGPVSSARPVVATTVPADPDALESGSPLAQALYQVWSGRSVTVVKSPPGAGKSTMICQAVTQLHKRSDLSIVVATPTRRGALELADKLGQAIGKARNGEPQVVVGMKTNPTEKTGEFVAKSTDVTSLRRRVTVRTIASCAASAPGTEVTGKPLDLLVIDEAYQAVFAQVALAAEGSTQLLLVGDPGQIGPVVQSDTSAWAAMSQGPHMRAPEVLEQDQDAFVLRLPSTWRLGQATVDAIAPLYDFPFDSCRPQRHLTDHDGTVLPEIRPMLVKATGEFDMGMLETVTAEAVSMIGMSVTETTPDGPVSRALDATDIAVVVARNGQDSTVCALLRRMGPHTDGITVGTADRLQGGQWHAVVAVDPLLGTDQVDDFRTGPGRLCVMASRHDAHLTWIHDGRWEQSLSAGTADPEAAAKGLAVRRALCSPLRTRRRAAA